MNSAGDLSPVQVSVWACQWVTLTLLRSSTVAQLKASFPVMSLSTRTAPLPLPFPRSWRFAPCASVLTAQAPVGAQAGLLKQMGLVLKSDDVIMRSGSGVCTAMSATG